MTSSDCLRSRNPVRIIAVLIVFSVCFLSMVFFSMHVNDNSQTQRVSSQVESSERWKEFMKQELRKVEQLREIEKVKAVSKLSNSANGTYARKLASHLVFGNKRILKPSSFGSGKSASRVIKPGKSTSEWVATATVLILTPLKNAAGHLNNYFNLLSTLTYNHSLISVAFGQDSSIDNTSAVVRALPWNSTNFHHVKVFDFERHLDIGSSWSDIHDPGMQHSRRSHMAKSRNELLMRALGDEKYILWVDVDVGEWPKDVIEQLQSADKDIVVPACMYRQNDGKLDVYDRNSWQETASSIAHQQMLDKGPDRNVLLLEGYGPTYRLNMLELRSNETIVPLDGVGGCVLLIRSVCHREGLIFPPFVFQHQLETEGLAKMAHSMGYGVYGMPYLEVIHS